MIETKDFVSNWTSPPGETIADLLVDRHLTLDLFAERIGKTADFAKNLLQGEVEITTNVASALESALGVSSAFWLSREAQFRADYTRITTSQANEVNREWLRNLPLSDMIKFGWLPGKKGVAEKFQACLEYFDVPNVPAWEAKYGAVSRFTAFKTSTIFASQASAVIAWLRQGERQAAQIQCGDWNVNSFRQLAPALRELSRKKNPADFLPPLRTKCAECGVALVIVRAPSGCRASGATFFLSSGQAVIQLSFRYLSDDHFWFTLFHEAAHLILHGNRLFLEADEMISTVEEEEANEFSAQTLIPYEFQTELHQLRSDSKMIVRFARKIGIAPGIVVGQLQHIGILARRQQNVLKRRFSWE